MSERKDHLPEEAPARPAGGSPGGQDPNTRVARGHEGETAAGATGKILDRLRSAKSGRSGREGTDREDDTSGPVDAGANYHPTDSRYGEHARGSSGQSMVGGTGVADDLAFQDPRPEDVDRRRERRAELVVVFWFLVSIAGTFAFVIGNFAINEHRQYYTPVLGVGLAFAVSGLGIGLVHWAKRLMPDEEAVQEREPHFSKPEELEATEATFARGFNDIGFARRPLLRRTLLAAGGALGLIAVVPVLNFGKLAGRGATALKKTSWETAPGEPPHRLVTFDGVPVKLGDVAAGSLLTVFPGKEKEGSPGEYERPDLKTKGDSTVILIRLRAGELTPKPGKENWVYEGHIAFSKICTHAGCPVSLYEQQTHHLLCPCHQSVFDVLDGGRPIFGPAARPLPQLPIAVDDQGYFVAQGDFTEPVGPSFWERG